MRGQRNYLGGLARLHLIETEEERRGTWRQSMATLAREVEDDHPVPLEGISPEALHRGVRAAFSSNLINDLDFLSPSAAAAALYELAAALPDGYERKEIGRRVLGLLRTGTAETFVSIATLLAQGNSKALSGPQIRARVALSLDLPFGLGARVDSLALALISRRDLQREWLTMPSSGSLPSRRLAARLLERAAREAARRAAAGDDTGVRIFGTPSVRDAWDRLLADRESLVWRHVAVARGLLSSALPSFGSEVERHLGTNLTPTEWRRAAASLAGSIAIRPDEAVSRGNQILQGPIPRADRGVASAMILGLPRAAEAEPEAVEELLEALVRVGSVAAAESLVELRRERLAEGFGDWASELARAHLREAAQAVEGLDDGKSALVEALDAELRPRRDDADPTLRDLLADALDAFATRGSRQAHDVALRALESARTTVAFLEECDDGDSYSRRWGFRALRELDTGLLETSTLGDLLSLGPRPSGEPSRPLDELVVRLTRWLVTRESLPVREAEIPHLSIRLRRLRTMLHLADAEWGSSSDARASRVELARVLLQRVRDDQPSPVRRTVSAAAARASDALVREELCELSDIVIAACLHLRDRQDFKTLAEASMVADVEVAGRALLRLATTMEEASADVSGTRACLRALLGVAQDLPLASSRRVEALRTALRGFATALLRLTDARSLSELVDTDESDALTQLRSSANALAQLVSGATRRLGIPTSDEAPQCGAAIRLIDFGIERAIKGATDPLTEAVSTAAEILREELPEVMADLGERALDHLMSLPIQTPPDAPRHRTQTLTPQRAPLPPWLPPTRTIGGFYVLHALGSGSAASVFAVKRVEERADPAAEKLALKVPEYDGSAALTLSEEQFHQLFRQEAGALLSLPNHRNLARFVTFDAGARPKPILVMELVEGPTLERAIAMGDLTVGRAFSLLDGIAAGLEAMHGVGVGHLDLKPSNVILRVSENDDAGAEVPVLVDLGLAGKTIRPGCGTPNYAAPEIWGLQFGDHVPSPLDADVYAFGCIIYEALTGRLLFDDVGMGELQKAHLSHDGAVPAVSDLARYPATMGLAQLITAALRQDPRRRPSIATLRAELAALAPTMSQLRWPIDGPSSETDRVTLVAPIPLTNPIRRPR